MKEEYQLLHDLLKQKKITYLDEMLKYVSKRLLAGDLGLTRKQLEEYWSDPDDNFLERVPRLTALLEIEELEILNIVLRTVARNEKK